MRYPRASTSLTVTARPQDGGRRTSANSDSSAAASANMSASAAQPIRVAIVEDDRRVRETLADFIGHASGFCCIHTWADGETALVEVARHKPDVVLMDINLPGMSGIDCARALK